MKQSTLYMNKRFVFDAVKEAAKNLDLEIRKASLSNGTLYLYSGGGLLSFGNNIDVKITLLETDKSVLKVESRSAAAIQLIDWGTNDNLESKIINEVKDILKG